ncbi:MAG: PDZ domain-containing protein [Halieaceae bacterium]|nr:Peptidase S1, chymotrypsin:PDZ/DHR/GLGF [marine gamma proteobacterium HTCC2080]MBT4854383.1 PDZ domain-containing protein [Halieaceae bacterium]MBT5209802.1 PDZ domain-containing protein [Halieaceae bacterium]MBT6333417.1 PDZ domain-containing protein [Halieaceae bacterium]MDG1828514.1 trypsin-like peptidase domain-containing protein [Luminiphilus sp.]
MKEFLSSLFWPTLTGILAAAIILDQWVLPEPLGRDRSQIRTSYSDAVALATPSVVNIYTAKLVDSGRNQRLNDPLLRRFLGNSGRRQRVERSLGSGVILTAEGHIITNNHVIADADAIQVLLHDGRSATATAIGTDPATDLAVLQIQLPGLTPITLANSDDAQVGDVVLAIGNPYGFGHSVSQGIISGLSRYGLQASDYEDYIQTDASVLLGSSGGALIDASGKLLGINTLIYTANGEGADNTAIGINLATPVNLAHFVMQDLVNYGTVVRGWLGVSVELLLSPETMAQQKQVLLVSALTEDGPAARAGLQLGDVISAINGNTVNDGRITMHQIARFRPGEIVDIEVARGREQEMIQLQAVVGTRPGG